MYTLNSLKYAAVLLPALAIGLPMANASDEQRNDPRNPERATAMTGKHFLETMPARGYNSDSLIGQEVKSRNNNESIGTISNLLLDEDDKVVAAIISIGGVLGIGERDVAIAWDQIERRHDGDETTLWVNLNEETLKEAPEFSSDTMYHRGEQQQHRGEQQRHDRADRADQRADQRMGQKRADQRSAHQSDDQLAGEQRSDQERADQRAAYGRTAQYLEAKPARGFQSDSLVGLDVKSRTNNETIGTVSNLLLDEDGQLVAVVVGVGGLLGMGERNVAIAWDQVERIHDGDDITLWVELNEQNLKDAPKYSSDAKRSRSRR